MNLQKLPGAPGYMVEVGDTQQQTNQNVINVLQTVVSSVQEQQAGQRKLLERTKPKKVVGHLWWKKEVMYPMAKLSRLNTRLPGRKKRSSSAVGKDLMRMEM